MDFVITWVDGADESWIEEKNKYLDNGMRQSAAQYREWGLLKYWFRTVEKYAPWVEKIYFVTCGQKPEWLNEDNPKLKLVNHKEFIPAEYLPTFSSHTIELNLHRIEGLSEKFVYFNDDMYLGASVKGTDFFNGDLPKFVGVMSNLIPSIPSDPFIHFLSNNISVINAHFNKRGVLKRNFFKWYNIKYGKGFYKNIYLSAVSKFTGFYNCHNPSSMLKSVFCEVWEKEFELLDKTCKNKFRQLSDVNQYVMSYYAACLGKFSPASPKESAFFTVGESDERIYNAFKTQKYKQLCINDNVGNIDFDFEKEKINSMMQSLFPEKSSFEK